MQGGIDLGKAAIVVAHPDDEILWFGSLIESVGQVVLCYGPNPRVAARGAQRRRVADAYPLGTLVFLDLIEPDTWRGRSLGPIDEEIRRTSLEDRAHAETLRRALAPVLMGVSTVFTHNPWGEYGHDDHRRVHSAVSDLAGSMGLDVYVSAYVDRNALPLMAATALSGVAASVSYPVDAAPIETVRQLYIDQNCWTWSLDWHWPEREFFHCLGAGGTHHATPCPWYIFNF